MKKIITLLLTVLITISLTAMTSGSDKDPNVTNQEVKSEVIQKGERVEKVQINQDKSSQTVKDRLGFDTGMTLFTTG